MTLFAPMASGTPHLPSAHRHFPIINPSDRVVAHTGPDADAPAFDGKAYIVLRGTWGSTDDEQLVNDSFSYAPGTPQVFSVEAADIGNLQSVSVRIEASGAVSK